MCGLFAGVQGVWSKSDINQIVMYKMVNVALWVSYGFCEVVGRVVLPSFARFSRLRG